MNSKNLSLSVLYVLGCTLASADAMAGRYDGLADLFNKATKHVEPPPTPKDLDLVYRPSSFDPPGMHGPTAGNPTPPPAPVAPPTSLTDTFNGAAGK